MIAYGIMMVRSLCGMVRSFGGLMLTGGLLLHWTAPFGLHRRSNIAARRERGRDAPFPGENMSTPYVVMQFSHQAPRNYELHFGTAALGDSK